MSFATQLQDVIRSGPKRSLLPTGFTTRRCVSCFMNLDQDMAICYTIPMVEVQPGGRQEHGQNSINTSPGLDQGVPSKVSTWSSCWPRGISGNWNLGTGETQHHSVSARYILVYHTPPCKFPWLATCKLYNCILNQLINRLYNKNKVIYNWVTLLCNACQLTGAAPADVPSNACHDTGLAYDAGWCATETDQSLSTDHNNVLGLKISVVSRWVAPDVTGR